MFRVLIGHNSELFARAIARKLGNDFDVRVCLDGIGIDALLDSFQPDIFLLNSPMPRRDALTILHKRPKLPRVTIVAVNYINNEQENLLRAVGVRRILLMPTADTAVATIRDFVSQEQMGNDDTDVYRVRQYLLALNFDTHLEGFRLICSAVPMLSRDPSQTLSKHVYPAIAKAHGLTDQRAVEHSIRNSIEKAWRHRHDAVWCRFFTPDAAGNISSPTNSKFLSTLAHWLSMKD